MHRPVVARFGDSVRIATPPEVLPAAYVSMATREVFVDREFRDRASWLLDAHISVSTWVWRIPLPGDSPLTPIPPGDESREFEERPVGTWDPARPPSEGDIRIVLGRVVPTTLMLDCVPIQASDERLSAGTISLKAAILGPGEPVREDFGPLGVGVRHGDPECSSATGGAISDPPAVADEGATVQVFGWAHRR